MKMINFSIHSTLVELGRKSDKVAGSPFSRRLADGRVIQVKGRYRKALIKKERARIAAKRSLAENSMEGVAFTPQRHMTVTVGDDAGTGLLGTNRGTNKYKFKQGEDPLSYKLTKWRKGNKFRLLERMAVEIDPNAGVRSYSIPPIIVTKPVITKRLDAVAIDKRRATMNSSYKELLHQIFGNTLLRREYDRLM